MENDELTQLKTIYDELWRDAKTMIKDVTRSISAVFFVGIMMFVIAIFLLLSAHQTYMTIVGGSTRTLDYFYLIAESLGVVIMIVAGILFEREYYKLKNRYRRIIQLEKTIGD
jgi:predicted membrane channel-forming protein YqfA (hemolysin III family)